MSRNHLHFEFSLLVLLFPSAGGQLNNHVGNLVQHHQVTSQLSNSMKFTNDILNIMNVKNDHLQLHSYIFYSENHAAALSNMIASQEGTRGTTITTCDESTTTLGQSMSKSSGDLVIIALCSPGHILQIFRMVKIKGISMSSSLWMLLLLDGKQKDKLNTDLRGLVSKNAKVAFIKEDFFGNLEIAYAAPNTGFFRFHKRGMANITDHNDDDYGNLQDFYRLLMKAKSQFHFDMEGKKLKVAGNNSPPFTLMPLSEAGELGPTSGVDFLVLDALGGNLNFTYDVRYSIDRNWGNVQSDGTVTGVVGMVHRREIDIAIGHLTISGSRWKVLDYTFPLALDRLIIISKAPKIFIPTFAVFTPFKPKVWLCMIMATLSIGPFLRALSRITETSLKAPSIGNLQTISFNAFRSTVVQGNLIQPVLWTHRVLFFSWYSFCLIIYAVYSGTLIAALAVPSYEEPIDSLTDFPKIIREGFVVGTGRDSIMYYLFQNAKEGIYKQTWDLFKEKNHYNEDVAYKRVLARKYAYISPLQRSQIEVVRYGPGKFHISREKFFFMWLGFGCTKGAPYVDTFSIQIMRMIETGLIEKWKSSILLKIKKVPETSKEEQRAIKLIYVQAAFYTLLIGSFVGTWTFTVEKLKARMKTVFHPLI